MHVCWRQSLSTYILGVGKRREKWLRTETSQIWRTQADRRKMAVCHRTCGKPLFYMYIYIVYNVYTFSGPVCLYWIFTDKMYLYSLTPILYYKFDEIYTLFCNHHIILYCGNYLVVTIHMPYHFTRQSISKFMFSNNNTSHKYYKYMKWYIQNFLSEKASSGCIKKWIWWFMYRNW